MPMDSSTEFDCKVDCVQPADFNKWSAEGLKGFGAGALKYKKPKFTPYPEPMKDNLPIPSMVPPKNRPKNY